MSGVEGESEVLTRALAIRERTLGPDHPEVSTTLHNLGEVARRRGQYTEAQALLERSLTIRVRAFGADHPEVGLALFELAELALTRGDLDAAEDQAERGLGLLERAYGAEHPSVISSRAQLERIRAARVSERVDPGARARGR